MAVNNARSLHGSSGEQDPLEFFLPDHDPEDDQEEDPEQDPGNAKQDQLIMTMEELIKKQKRQLYQDDANEKAQAQHEAKQRHKKEKEDKITLLLKEMKQLASIQEGRKKEVGMYNRSENWKKEKQSQDLQDFNGAANSWRKRKTSNNEDDEDGADDNEACNEAARRKRRKEKMERQQQEEEMEDMGMKIATMEHKMGNIQQQLHAVHQGGNDTNDKVKFRWWKAPTANTNYRGTPPYVAMGRGRGGPPRSVHAAADVLEPGEWEDHPEKESSTPEEILVFFMSHFFACLDEHDGQCFADIDVQRLMFFIEMTRDDWMAK